MFFRKNVYDKINDIAARIDVRPEEFLGIPELGFRVDKNILRFSSGEPVILNFAEAQLLTKKLSKDYSLDMRMPRTSEGYVASHKLGLRNHQHEWRSELIDGSFLMFNPEVRPVKNDRRYDFFSNDTSLVYTSRYVEPKDNGEYNWLGICKDEYDRTALVSNLDDKCSIGAFPPLSPGNLGIRLLIDEKQ